MKWGFLALLLATCQCRAQLPDTRIGTAASTTLTAGRFGKGSEEHGHTLPAVLEPHGMTFWTPQTRATEQKCICPYYYADTRLQGFRASHWVVGGCTQDYGSFTLMPTTQCRRLDADARSLPFHHDQEVATPAYYRVQLPDIVCEMTGRSRSAIFHFTFKHKKQAYLVFETNSDEGEGTVQFLPERGQVRASNPVHRIYQGWGERAGMTGYALLQLRPEDVHSWGHEGKQLLWVRLNKTDILVKMGTSFTDFDGAQRNLQTEIPHWDFNRTRTELERIWEKSPLKFSTALQLPHKGKEATAAEQSSPTRDFREAFKGALYHSSFLPHVLNDVVGR